MKARTQIRLDPETHSAARARAGDLGISLAEYVRRIISKDLKATEETPDISSIFALGNSGRGDSGGSNVARNKDAMVAESLASKLRRQKR